MPRSPSYRQPAGVDRAEARRSPTTLARHVPEVLEAVGLLRRPSIAQEITTRVEVVLGLPRDRFAGMTYKPASWDNARPIRNRLYDPITRQVISAGGINAQSL